MLCVCVVCSACVDFVLCIVCVCVVVVCVLVVTYLVIVCYCVWIVG